MNKQTEVILSGVGGQGLIVCGTLLGEAAVLYDGKRATLSSEYGVETRGTFAKSDVIVSDGEIYYPDAMFPKVVLALAQVAYDRYAGKLPQGAVLIYDSDQVTPDPAVSAQEGLPITTMARALGHSATANILSMGLVVARTGIVSPQAGEQAVAAFFQPKGEKLVELNRKAFRQGLTL